VYVGKARHVIEALPENPVEGHAGDGCRGVIVKRRTRPDIQKRSLKKGGPYGR